MEILSNKNKKLGILALILLLAASIFAILPAANAHSPAWQIPTHAFIVVAPSPIGVGQPTHVYMWLDAIFGSAGGTSPAIGTNGSTTSGALLSNNYRFHNYQLKITGPDGTVTTKTFDTILDTTSSQFTQFLPDKIGQYTFDFSFPGQAYTQYAYYEKSILVNDTYLPSFASTTLTVQQAPLPAPITSYPLPTGYWARPIYGENTDWWSISSNWLGNAAPVLSGYSSSPLYRADAIGPLTSHVMWTRPLQFGGVVGGNLFADGGAYPSGAPLGVGYFEGSSYAPRFINPIIMGGYLYYAEVASFTGSDIMGSTATGPTVCIDLRTGKEIWRNPSIPRLQFGYIYNVWNPDQHGVYPPILVASIGGGFTGLPAMWAMFDAYTGLPLFNVTNVPSGATVAGPSGEQIKYVFANAGTPTNPQWYLAQWNSSKLWLYDINPYTGGGSLSPSIINASNGMLVQVLPVPITGETGILPNGTSSFVPYNSALTVNANVPLNAANAQFLTTYDWNISQPFMNTMPLQPTYNINTGQTVPAAPGTNPVSVIAASYGDVILCRNGTLPTGFGANRNGYPQLPYTLFTINLNSSKGPVGQVLWTKTYDPPAGNLSLIQGPVDFQTRVIIFSYQEVMQWVGYSLDTGDKLWGPTASQSPFDYYGNPGTTTLPGSIAYGKLYCSSFSGILYCYDDKTGTLLWTYGNGGPGNSTYAGLTVFYGDYPTMIQAIGNGVVYLATDEHTVPNPIYKGATARAVNATTGKEIWQLSDYPSEWSAPGLSFVIADGYLACMNGYDQQVYSVGRGPSATSVSTRNDVIPQGSKVLIQGSVIDISAGTTQSTQAANFPHGVPVAADVSMKDWMGYVYQQKPIPTNFTGVPVHLTATDPNGNYQDIGTTTSNILGNYAMAWTPPVPGLYTITATFEGSNAYYGSNAGTSFIISDTSSVAPIVTTTPTPTTAPTSVPTQAPTSPSPSIAPQPAGGIPITTYIAIAAAVIIIAVLTAAVVLRRRK